MYSKFKEQQLIINKYFDLQKHIRNQKKSLKMQRSHFSFIIKIQSSLQLIKIINNIYNFQTAQPLMSQQQKLYEQELLLSKLAEQQKKLQLKLKEFQLQMQHRMNSHDNAPRQKIKLNTQQKQKLIYQLKKEVETAQNMLKNYQIQYKSVAVKYSKISTNTLDDLQKEIEDKREKIRNIKEETKDLQFVKRKQEKAIEKKKKEEDGVKLTKLLEEVKKHKEIVENMRIKNQKKKETLNKKKEEVMGLQKHYEKACKDSGKKFVSMEDLKEKKKQKSKQIASHSSKDHKKIQTVKEIINTQQYPKSQTNLQYNKRTHDELVSKKDIALSSLQNFQKKYQKQIGGLQKKLEYIQQDHKILLENLSLRRQEGLNGVSENKTARSMSKSNYHSSYKLTPLS